MTPEVLIFLQAIGIGALLGCCYDIFRILRLAFPRGKILIFFEDIIYFACVAICSFSFVLIQTNGILRIFVLLGELLGAIIYFFTIGVLVMKMAGVIIRIIKRFFYFLFLVLFKPTIRFLKWIISRFVALGKALKNLGKKIFSWHKKDLKPDKTLVYTKTNNNNKKSVSPGKKIRSRKLWRSSEQSRTIKSEIQGS